MRVEGGTLHLDQKEAEQARQGNFEIPNARVNGRWQGQGIEFEVELQGKRYSITELQQVGKNPQVEGQGTQTSGQGKARQG